MMTAAARIERVVIGVIRQAMADARASRISITGDGSAASLLSAWCRRGLGSDVVGLEGLVLHPASKTELLLGLAPPADILPFGDLYHSELCELAPDAKLPDSIAAIVAESGGAAGVDEALALFYDRRLPWTRAVAHLGPAQAKHLEQALEAARFRRSRVAIVPKLGARTLGVDLYA